VVVKPSRGKGSRNTSLVRHEAEGRDLVSRLLDRDRAGHETRLVVEEYLAGGDTAPYGDYVSVESVCSAGSVRHVGVTGKLPLAYPYRETGQFHPAVLPCCATSWSWPRRRCAPWGARTASPTRRSS
jgi:hypothetical protein